LLSKTTLKPAAFLNLRSHLCSFPATTQRHSQYPSALLLFITHINPLSQQTILHTHHNNITSSKMRSNIFIGAAAALVALVAADTTGGMADLLSALRCYLRERH